VIGTLRTRGASKLGVGLLFSCLVACAGILGIEDRSEDTAANYPIDGYDGCREGDCSRCLEMHREACESRASCGDVVGKGECAACVCQNCLDPLATCQQDEGCTAIWECLRDSRCDLSERAQGSCSQRCGSVIQANGGVNGASFQAALEIRSCATSSACLSCLAPQVTQSSLSCTQQNGCQECPDCFNQCLCSGEKFGDCKVLCKDQGGDTPSSSVCSEADQCAGCTTCLHACSCNGGSYDACLGSCTAPPDDETPVLPAGCSAADGCAGCRDCTSQCQCSGGDNATCASACAPASSDVCREDPGGLASSCGACESCVAKCTCNGDPIESCWGQCTVHDCKDLPGDAYGCSCAASDPRCFSDAYGSCDGLSGDCESCACRSCPGELGTCKDTERCEAMFQCMRSTGCQGRACLERCRDSAATPESFAYAEALWACYQGSGCGTNCSTNPPPPSVECPTIEGSARCQGFVGVGVSFEACCPSVIIYPLLDPGSTSTGGDDNACGLVMSGEYDARLCEPLAQTNPPRYEALETCPGRIAPDAPYNGALLKGCCRGSDNTCGYYDDITGLGCLSAGVFGDAVQTCP
jgi:hypothetical protein